VSFNPYVLAIPRRRVTSLTRRALNAAADALAKAERSGGHFAVTLPRGTMGMILANRPGAEHEAALAVLAEVREGRFGVASPQTS